MTKPAIRKSTAWLIVLSLAGLLFIFSIVIRIWYRVGGTTEGWDLWAMIESVSTALAVIVAVVGAIWAYSDTAKDRHRDVADRFFLDLSLPESVQARRLIYQELPEFSQAALADLTPEMRDAIKDTLTSLDRAGFMIQSGWIPKDVIVPWISPIVVKVWAKLKDYVDYEASTRGEPDYYQAVRSLANWCEAYRRSEFPDTPITWRDGVTI